MDTLEKDPTEHLKTITLQLVNEIEDGLDHPETWQKIADLSSPDEQDGLKQLTFYISQLIALPQSERTWQLLAVLEAMCFAFSGHEDLAKNQLTQLTQKYPQSALYSGALNFIQKKSENTAPSQPANEINEVFLKTFIDYVTMQNTTNQAFLSKLHSIESRIERSKLENAHLIEQKLHHIEQTMNLIARRLPRGNAKRVRCVFIISFLQAWNTLADVYYAMKASNDFEPIVVSTARKMEKNTGKIFGEELTHDFLVSEGIPHIRLDTAKDKDCMDMLKALEPDIIFRQSPWQDLPPIFNPAEINFARLCYVPYSFTAVKRIGKDEPKDAVSSLNHTDLYYHRLCWRIFCETEMHKEMYSSSIRAGENVVVTGYPKFDRLIAAKSSAPFWPIAANSNKPRFRIIWAPHHSVTPDVMAFGTFVSVHKEMLEWARQSSNDFEFVMKPHPALVSEVVHALKAYSQEYMDAFFAEWNALPNTAMYEGGDYGPLFVASDAMLTDGVGFLSEYQLFEKPLIFLDSGCHFGFNAAGQVMVESANTIKTVTEAKALCTRLKNGEADPMRATQQATLAKIMPYPGQSAEKILQAIREGLTAEGVIG